MEQLELRRLLVADLLTPPESIEPPYVGVAEGEFGVGLEEEPPTIPMECTLRAAIQQAHHVSATSKTIMFANSPPGASALTGYIVNSNRDGSDSNLEDGVCWTGEYYTSDVSLIQPKSGYVITAPIKIQGNVDPYLTPRTEINGLLAGPENGFMISATGASIGNLAITQFQKNGIHILNGNNNDISGSFIGTDRTGTIASANGHNGVRIENGNNNTLGKGQWNVISGNTLNGILIQSGNGNVVAQNYIGTDRWGEYSLGTQQNGVEVQSTAGNNTIGPLIGMACNLFKGSLKQDPCTNVISGNTYDGVVISGTGPAGSTVSSSRIGTNRDGSGILASTSNNAPRSNLLNGVNIVGTPSVNISGNTISGNIKNGILLDNAGNGKIIGNRIGSNLLATVAVANGKEGILATNGSSAAYIENNVISGNTLNGIHLQGSTTTGAKIRGNYIGTDGVGLSPIKNVLDGILSDGGSKAHIIGIDGFASTNFGLGNKISGNGGNGVTIDDGVDTRIAGNLIGTNINGRLAIPNANHGIHIKGSATKIWIGVDNVPISGTAIPYTQERNVISGNMRSGVYIESTASAVTVAGNIIGSKEDGVNGSYLLGNGDDGVTVLGPNNYVGTDGDGNLDSQQGNSIQANTKNGVRVTGSTATGNKIAGNVIMHNVKNGVAIDSGARQNIVGNDGIGTTYVVKTNTISSNGENGVNIQGASTQLNRVAGNRIGVDVSGFSKYANTLDGVRIEGVATSNIIGTNGDGIGDNKEGNIISGNTLAGVRIKGAGTNRNYVAGNTIGLTALQGQMGNGKSGVVIEDNATENNIGIDTNANGNADEPNIISGNKENGVHIIDASKNDIRGNIIGTNNKQGDLKLPNGFNGIRVDGKSVDNTIGTRTSGVNPTAIEKDSGNVIAYNGIAAQDDANIPNLRKGHGVVIRSANATGNSVRLNSIFSNEGRGIDLYDLNSKDDFATVNDETDYLIVNGFQPTTANGDKLLGANRQQDYPHVVRIVDSKTNRIKLQLDSSPLQDVFIDIYDAKNSMDPSGYGEAKQYLRTVVGKTNDLGKLDIDSEFPSRYISMTATNKATGDTSEFSMVDSDGDALADQWESNGIDRDEDGNRDLNLTGAKNGVLDIFVEVDQVARAIDPVSKQPLYQYSQADYSAIQLAFENGASDDMAKQLPFRYSLHIEQSDLISDRSKWNLGRLPSLDTIKLDANNPAKLFPGSNYGANAYWGNEADRVDLPNASPPTVKNLQTMLAKRLTHRYLLVGIDQPGGFSGESEIWGNDTLITLGSNSASYSWRTGTFMHELGHALGLKHGGGDHENFKPNYLSVMNYMWQSAEDNFNGTNPHSYSGWALDYSRYALASVDENQMKDNVPVDPMNHNRPFDVPILINGSFSGRNFKSSASPDWNDNVVHEATPYALDYNGGGLTVLEGFNDWYAIPDFLYFIETANFTDLQHGNAHGNSSDGFVELANSGNVVTIENSNLSNSKATELDVSRDMMPASNLQSLEVLALRWAINSLVLVAPEQYRVLRLDEPGQLGFEARVSSRRDAVRMAATSQDALFDTSVSGVSSDVILDSLLDELITDLAVELAVVSR